MIINTLPIETIEGDNTKLRWQAIVENENVNYLVTKEYMHYSGKYYRSPAYL